MDKPTTMKNYVQLVLNRLSIIGFTLYDYPDLIAEADAVLAEAAVEGKISLDGAETIVDIHGRLEEQTLVNLLRRWLIKASHKSKPF